jgi:allophanate hydrolase subunit 1
MQESVQIREEILAMRKILSKLSVVNIIDMCKNYTKMWIRFYLYRG